MSDIIDLINSSELDNSNKSGSESDLSNTVDAEVDADAELVDHSEQSFELTEQRSESTSFSQPSTSSSQSNDTILCRQRAIFLLDWLRPPRKPDFNRKWRTAMNPPPFGKCKCRNTNSSVSSSAAATIRPQK